MENIENKAHIPVLLDEVISYLNPCDGETYVDCTFGDGGYSEAILKKAKATIYAFDLDPEASAAAVKIKTNLGKRADDLHFFQCNFIDLESKLKGVLVDAIIADLGVSSMQIDQASRGFSFQKEGFLDMRMSQSGLSASDIVNNYSEEELRNIIYKYGEENRAKQIAQAIVRAREVSPITKTLQLAEIIRGVFTGQRKKKIDFATKTFQAIRICVNGEIDNLKKLLEISERVLKEGGRLIIVSFHALEDRAVKNFMRDKSIQSLSVSRYLPECAKELPSFKLVTKKPITPSSLEIDSNIRARSAKLRVATRINRSKENV